MERSEKSVEFQLDGLPVRMTHTGERWVARVGHSVAVGSSARVALLAALELLGKANIRALFADLGRIDAVVNVAGVVDFNPPLDEALDANAFGPTNLVNLARALGDAPLYHTSTCYTAGRRPGSGLPGVWD